MHKKTPNAIHADPYNKPLVKYLFCSNTSVANIAKPPNKNKITAEIIFKPSSKMLSLPIMAKAIIKAPPNNNRIERINCSQMYLLNKLFIWNSSVNTIIVFEKGT